MLIRSKLWFSSEVVLPRARTPWTHANGWPCAAMTDTHWCEHADGDQLGTSSLESDTSLPDSAGWQCCRGKHHNDTQHTTLRRKKRLCRFKDSWISRHWSPFSQDEVSISQNRDFPDQADLSKLFSQLISWNQHTQLVRSEMTCYNNNKNTSLM